MIDKILPGYAGIDVGASEFYVAAAGAAEPVKRFGTFTSEIRLLTAYLKEHGVQKAAMETTGVYWVPLHDALEAAGIEVTVFNGAHARNLPGRKSDASDCQWHGMLHSHGLLSPIFIPPQEILELRAYHRLREDHIAMAASHIQHMQRALDLMNVRLHNVISQIHGVSGLKIVRAILAGERDPVALALLCDQQILKHKKQEVIKSLEGNWREHHLFALGQALEGYEFYQKQIADCDANIERILRKLGRQQEPPRPPRGGWPKEARHNAPLIENLQGKLLNCSGGCDPTRLPGFSPLTFMKLVAELGTDLSPWPTEKHFTSWLGLSPGKHQSGRKRRRVKRPHTRVAQIFRECVLSIAKSRYTAMGAFYRRLKARRGPAVAATAVARKLAELYYRTMTKGMAYVEEGVQRYEEQYRQQTLNYLQKMASNFNCTLVSKDPAPDPT